MSWLNKIKSLIFEEKKEIKSEAPAKVINFEDISSLLEEKAKVMGKKEGEIKNRVINRINELGGKLEEGVNLLERVNLNERKENERLKLIVKENSHQYASLVLRLISKLKEVGKGGERKEKNKIEIKILLENIVKSLNEFYKSSIIPFQKSIILIGAEMENIKIAIKEFSDEIVLIGRENEAFFNEYELTIKINALFLEFKEEEKQGENMVYLLEEQRNKEIYVKKEYDKIENEINIIKNGKDYEENVKEREKKKNEIGKKISELKAGIDFKELSKQYHSIEKIHKIIKKYSDNFSSALIGDKELEFERVLVDENQKELLRELRDKLMDSIKEEQTKVEENINLLEKMRENIRNELKTMESNIEIIGKKKEKLINRKNKLKEEIMTLVEKIF